MGAAKANDEANYMALIEEDIAEAERDIVEGTELLSGENIKTDDKQDKHMMHPEDQLLTVENVYNLQQRGN